MKSSDQEFTEFYGSTWDECLKIVLVVTGDRQLAEDLVAEAFTRAWVSWRKVRVHPAPRAWVVRTALNTRVSWWRRRHREVPGNGRDLPSPEQDYLLDDPLVVAVRHLPARQRDVITLRVLCDLDTASTARLLGISPGTVGVHMSRALDTLRKQVPVPGPTSQTGETACSMTTRPHTSATGSPVPPRDSRPQV